MFPTFIFLLFNHSTEELGLIFVRSHILTIIIMINVVVVVVVVAAVVVVVVAAVVVIIIIIWERDGAQ